MSSRRDRPDATLGLIDYVLAALLRLGGEAGVVDLEDIAVEAYRLAPDRFRWRRHDFPNLELVRVTISDANKRGTQLVIYDRKGRKLTVDGARRAGEVLRRLDAGVVVQRDDALRRQDLVELARMEVHPAFIHWSRCEAIDLVDLADLARCSTSTPTGQFADRLRRSQAIADYWHRDTLVSFLGTAVDRLPSMISEEGQ